jgi:hypothetical protein
MVWYDTHHRLQGLVSPVDSGHCWDPSTLTRLHPDGEGPLHSLTVLPSYDTAQRSAQELPLVERQSTDSYPVVGGKKMILSGHNFLQDSKVIFVEKAPGMFF